MYTGKLYLTNDARTPFSLSNNFDNTFAIIDAAKDCVSAEEFCKAANKYHNYGKTWTIDRDDDNETRLIYRDALGNKRYLIAEKEKSAETSMFLVYEKNYLNYGEIDCIDESEFKLYSSKKSAFANMRSRKKKYIENKDNDFTFMENESTETCYVFADELTPDGASRSGEFHICLVELGVN